MVTGNGYALVVVLWLVSLLTVITGAYHLSARTENRLLSHELRRAQAEALAEAGVWIAARRYFKDGVLPPSAREKQTIRFADTEIEVEIADVAGKVNLNLASRELLDGVLAHGGVPPGDRQRLVEAIVDWRDPDHDALPYGAEDAEYAAAGLPYGPRDAAFVTVDELRRVLGMTDEVYRRIEDLLTVHGNARRVNPYAATAEVLQALPGAGEGSVNEILSARTEEGNAPVDLALSPGFTQTRRSDTYVFTSTARVGDVTARVAATLRRSSERNGPSVVLEWSDRDD